MADMNKKPAIEKIETGISGFEMISDGGLPKNRTTLVSGTAGSAKTVMAAQFLAEGIKKYGDGGVFVTFEETPSAIRENMQGFGWDIETWESEGKWAFIDGSPSVGEENPITGDYDLGALLARIEHAVRKIKAKRLSVDSIGAIFSRFADAAIVRGEILRITTALKQLGITSLLTAERTEEYGSIARFGIEEFVTDNVVILRNVLEGEKRRRTIEILKYRGTSHKKGEFPFTVIPDEGMVVIPLSAIELTQKSSTVRVSSGIPELDKICGGGFFRDSVILISGATGTGKTLAMTHFVGGIAKKGEKCLLFAFEESREQLYRNAAGWGYDFPRLDKAGKLKVVCRYPETAGLEDHLIDMKKIIAEFKPNRVGLDSLSALERVATMKGFREFVIDLTSFIKELEITGLFTSTTSSLMGGTSVTEAHISTITDSIILLRYVEMFGEMRRGLTVLKMRGSWHDKEIREYEITKNGMVLGKAFRNVTGILSGQPAYMQPEKFDRLGGLFAEAGQAAAE